MLVTLKQTIVAIRMRVENLVELGATQWTKINVGSLVVFLHVKPKSHAIQPGQQPITEQVIQGPAKYMHKKNIVLMGLTDLAGRRDGGHLKIGLTVKEEQHLSALNVAVKDWTATYMHKKNIVCQLSALNVVVKIRVTVRVTVRVREPVLQICCFSELLCPLRQDSSRSSILELIGRTINWKNDKSEIGTRNSEIGRTINRISEKNMGLSFGSLKSFH